MFKRGPPNHGGTRVQSESAFTQNLGAVMDVHHWNAPMGVKLKIGAS